MILIRPSINKCTRVSRQNVGSCTPYVSPISFNLFKLTGLVLNRNIALRLICTNYRSTFNSKLFQVFRSKHPPFNKFGRLSLTLGHLLVYFFLISFIIRRARRAVASCNLCITLFNKARSLLKPHLSKRRFLFIYFFRKGVIRRFALYDLDHISRQVWTFNMDSIWYCIHRVVIRIMLHWLICMLRNIYLFGCRNFH